MLSELQDSLGWPAVLLLGSRQDSRQLRLLVGTVGTNDKQYRTMWAPQHRGMLATQHFLAMDAGLNIPPLEWRIAYSTCCIVK